MALKRYNVTVQNRRNKVETIMKLTPEQAAEVGAEEYVKGKQAKAPANKSRSASNKGRGGSRKSAPKKPAEKPAESAPSSDATPAAE
ncbi:MAG: hypothetical protein WED09_07245 [Homoserinimonas sp.]